MTSIKRRSLQRGQRMSNNFSLYWNCYPLKKAKKLLLEFSHLRELLINLSLYYGMYFNWRFMNSWFQFDQNLIWFWNSRFRNQRKKNWTKMYTHILLPAVQLLKRLHISTLRSKTTWSQYVSFRRMKQSQKCSCIIKELLFCRYQPNGRLCKLLICYSRYIWFSTSALKWISHQQWFS